MSLKRHKADMKIEDDTIRQAKKKERQQYDKDRYLQNKEIYCKGYTTQKNTTRGYTKNESQNTKIIGNTGKNMDSKQNNDKIQHYAR